MRLLRNSLPIVRRPRQPTSLGGALQRQIGLPISLGLPIVKPVIAPILTRSNLTSPTRPKALNTLKLGLVGVGAGVSTLQIDVNGHKGRAYWQHPRWQGAPTDEQSTKVLEVELPTSALRQGVNNLILTAIDEPEFANSNSETGVTYDAIELDRELLKESFAPTKVRVQIRPTIYYQQKAEQLVELVEVYVRHNSLSREDESILR